jgi:CheY-like chemotaxis protein
MAMARVLVVDDNATVRALIEEVVRAAGHSAISAADGQAGLIAFETNKADLVITDMLMPKMDGAEFILRLRAFCPDVKIVAISGGGGALDKGDLLMSAVTLGADAAVPKPFRPSQLRHVVAAVLGLAPGASTPTQGEAENHAQAKR